jgi:hypothetical protein
MSIVISGAVILAQVTKKAWLYWPFTVYAVIIPL